jgi:hypothetical protein
VEGGAVAKIATVAVANPEERKNSTLPKVSPGGTGDEMALLVETLREHFEERAAILEDDR